MTARDIVFIPIILFALGIGLFAMKFAADNVVDKISLVPEVNESEPAMAAINQVDTASNKLDYVFFGLFIGLNLTLIITAWLFSTRPIFMFVYILVIVLVVAISPALSNSWEAFSQHSTFTGLSVEQKFPVTNHILVNLPYYAVVIGFIGMVLTFARGATAKDQ